MTPKFNILYTQALISTGLTNDQAQLYQLLLQMGGLQAGRIPRFMEVSRPHAYKLLQELIDLGIATKNESPGKPARYVPAHPFAVQELLRKQREELEISNQTVQGVMGSLISEYTRSSQLPGVRIIPGTEGLTELYKDILEEKLDLCIIRSTHDDITPELQTLVFNAIKKQGEQGIRARIIGPLPTDISIDELKKRDEERLTERRVLPRAQFSLPAQMTIYGDKVALVAYEQDLITTIIENKAIKATFQVMFEIIWQVAKTSEEINEHST